MLEEPSNIQFQGAAAQTANRVAIFGQTLKQSSAMPATHTDNDSNSEWAVGESVAGGSRGQFVTRMPVMTHRLPSSLRWTSRAMGLFGLSTKAFRNDARARSKSLRSSNI